MTRVFEYMTIAGITLLLNQLGIFASTGNVVWGLFLFLFGIYLKYVFVSA